MWLNFVRPRKKIRAKFHLFWRCVHKKGNKSIIRAYTRVNCVSQKETKPDYGPIKKNKNKSTKSSFARKVFVSCFLLLLENLLLLYWLLPRKTLTRQIWKTHKHTHTHTKLTNTNWHSADSRVDELSWSKQYTHVKSVSCSSSNIQFHHTRAMFDST